MWVLLRRSHRAVRAVLFSAVVVLAPARARAQYLPLGGRTASMGGAAAAWGRDSAMPYLNPAGYALVPHPTLSLSASLYRTELVNVSDFFFHGRLDPALGSLT